MENGELPAVEDEREDYKAFFSKGQTLETSPGLSKETNPGIHCIRDITVE